MQLFCLCQAHIEGAVPVNSRNMAHLRTVFCANSKYFTVFFFKERPVTFLRYSASAIGTSVRNTQRMVLSTIQHVMVVCERSLEAIVVKALSV